MLPPPVLLPASSPPRSPDAGSRSWKYLLTTSMDAQGLDSLPRGKYKPPQISRITGIIIGRRPVVFWIIRFSSTRTFSFTMP